MALNLEYLIPEKYRSSDVMTALLVELETLIGGWTTDIQGLGDLVNPNLVSNDYMQYLADLMGAVLVSSDNATEQQRRDELIQVVDWIKTKGTYQSLDIIGLIRGRKYEYLDMYTNDYVTFSLQDWFVGLSEGSNPSGLDSTYYKSAHFGIQTKLDIKYSATGTWLYDHLWIPSMFDNLNTDVEKTRPINTVPHYYVLLVPETNDDNVVNIGDGDINTMIVGTWTTTKLHFDQDLAIGSGEGFEFDAVAAPADAENFDQSQDNFYTGITKWILGTGSKGLSPGDSGWAGDIETEALTGTFDSVTVHADRIVWEFIVEAQTLSGISELGLYTPGSPDTLRVVSLFPDINLGGNVDLRIVVTVNRV